VDREALDVHAEDRLGVRARLGLVLGDLDAAGLAAPPIFTCALTTQG
jgi:hypothetical protein